MLIWIILIISIVSNYGNQEEQYNINNYPLFLNTEGGTIISLPPLPLVIGSDLNCNLFKDLNFCPEVLPKCTYRRMNVNDVGFGNLVRSPYGDDDRLYYPPEIEIKESLLVLFRVYPARVEHAGQDPYDVPAATLYSFSKTLEELDPELRKFTTVIILISNHMDQAEFRDWTEWSNSLFANHPGTIAIYKTPTGNVESYVYMMNLINLIMEDGIPEITIDNNRTIIYLLEDDYIHDKYSTRNLVDIFSSHEPCFAVPYDYPDRYYMKDIANADDNRVSVLAGQYHHWRTVRSTTVTFATRAETIRALWINLPTPQSDFWNMHILTTYFNVSVLSPIPGLASHTETYNGFRVGAGRTNSLYRSWLTEGREIVELLKQISGNIWERRARRSGTYKEPVEFVEEEISEANY